MGLSVWTARAPMCPGSESRCHSASNKQILPALVSLCSLLPPQVMTGDDRFHFLINFIMYALGTILLLEAPWRPKYIIKNATRTVQVNSCEKEKLPYHMGGH